MATMTGRWLIAGSCVLLAGLAVAMGVTSFHAQFTYIFATKRQWTPALLEAIGLDAGAVIFSLLGIALARLGRRALVERVLVVTCALGSCGMNVLNANLGSPRSVAVYAMPPVLFALSSDRLDRGRPQAALGKAADDVAQRSAWHLAGRLASLRHALRGGPPWHRERHPAGNPERGPAPAATAPQGRRSPSTQASSYSEAIRGGELTAKPGSVWAVEAAAPTDRQRAYNEPVPSAVRGEEPRPRASLRWYRTGMGHLQIPARRRLQGQRGTGAAGSPA